MANSEHSEPFSLAIIGGGIAGCILSITLLKHKIPHTLYESASQFGEIGAGVGFEPNFVRTMEAISPDIKEAFLRCAERTDDRNPVWITVRVGDRRKADSDGVVMRKDGKDIKLGEELFDWPARPGPRGGVHRAHFLNELVKLIPSHITKFRKRLVDVKEAGDGSGDAVLCFADGSSARHSAVFGCDGIKSKTRELVLGKEEGMPVFSGKVAYRGLIPMAKAEEILGEEVARKAQLYCGYHRHVLTYPIAKGSLMNVVAFDSRDSWTDPEWAIPISREAMIEAYSGFTPAVQSILSNMHNSDVWALFNHSPARTYYQSRPRVCLVGDAAHASTPFQAAGAGMCVEDCYILGELLGEAKGINNLDKIFQAYDAVRRPRTLRLVKTSLEAGRKYMFEGPEGDDLFALERDFKDRLGWIWDTDINEDLERARQIVRTGCEELNN